jgi:hypothetical protein
MTMRRRPAASLHTVVENSISGCVTRFDVEVRRHAGLHPLADDGSSYE